MALVLENIKSPYFGIALCGNLAGLMFFMHFADSYGLNLHGNAVKRIFKSISIISDVFLCGFPLSFLRI